MPDPYPYDESARLVAEEIAGDNALALSVGELSLKLKRMVEGEFGHVRLRGEISGYKRATSGHVYMSLKDENAVIDAVMWKGAANTLPFQPQDGIEVIATGRLTTFPGRSKYQIVVERMDFPYRLAGRRAPDRPPVLINAVNEGAAALAKKAKCRPTSVALGGRSMGGRICSMAVADGLPAAALVLISYPLHPPGKPERSRLAELEGTGVPTLVVQGERDTFGRPEEFPPDVDLAVVPAADHGLKVPASGPVSQADALEIVVESTLEWLVREVTGAR